MIDGLPFEIRVEIMKRLPVKILIQVRTVSKAWRSLIDSSDFVSGYHTQQQQLQLLVAYDEPGDDNLTYVSIADDESFPQSKLSPTVPFLVKMLARSRPNVIGSSHGLVCLHGVYSKNQTDITVLWNPSIRRAIPIVVPNVVYGIYDTLIGFGVCRVTIDPKIVKITYIERESDMDRISSIPWQVEVFSLSTGVWRSPCSNLPRKSIQFFWLWLQVVVDGFIYWRAIDRINNGDGYDSYNLIISFDITTEEFREVNLPHSLLHVSIYDLSISELSESLVVLHHNVDANNTVIDVYMMEDMIPNIFTKLFTVNVNMPHARIVAFRKSGEPIIDMPDDDFPNIPIFKLVVYDPYSKHIDNLEISRIGCSFYCEFLHGNITSA